LNAQNEEGVSGLFFPLKEGKVTGLPKDPVSAPQKLQLSKKIHELGEEALKKAQHAGEEWGFFLHFDETGQIRPGDVQGPSDEGKKEEIPTWITRDEYLEIKRQDPTIHGLLHIHPEDPELPDVEPLFSWGNLGLFLDVEDTLLLCKGSHGDYLLALRTQQTPSSYKGIGKKATEDFKNFILDELAEVIEEGLEEDSAKSTAMFRAMLEVCKKYNIAVYKGSTDKPALKLLGDTDA
jgi:hypothetical protein